MPSENSSSPNFTSLVGSKPHPDFAYTFFFESDFDPAENIEWVRNNQQIGYIAVLLYLLGVYFGPKWMKNKKAYDLKLPLILWNVVLAFYSTLGSFRVVPELIFLLKNDGLHRAVCRAECLNYNVCQFWGWTYTFSKFIEFGDTAFLILRKKRVIFLHWYHHITVLLLVWNCYISQYSPSRWFGIVNGVIHSVMYSYFALKGIGLKIPKIISIVITIAQILQMFLGFYISLFVLKQILNGVHCDATLPISVFAVVVYSSYFVLFVKYFYMAYVVPSQFKKEISLEMEDSSKIKKKD